MKIVFEGDCGVRSAVFRCKFVEARNIEESTSHRISFEKIWF